MLKPCAHNPPNPRSSGTKSIKRTLTQKSNFLQPHRISPMVLIQKHHVYLYQSNSKHFHNFFYIFQKFTIDIFINL